MDKWQHANYEQMNCFYAGKVCHLWKCFNFRLRGCRKRRALFLLRWPTTDTSMSACSVEPVGGKGLRSCVDLIKASTSIIRRFALTTLTTNHRSPTKKSRLSSSSLGSDTKVTTLRTSTKMLPPHKPSIKFPVAPIVKSTAQVSAISTT